MNNNWFSTTFRNYLPNVTSELYDLWEEMITEGKKEILCTGPGGAGRLRLTANELMDTINFLETINEIEEIQ